MATSYTGGWRRQTVNPSWAVSSAGTVPDSQHKTPDALYGDRYPGWQIPGARIQPTPQGMTDDEPVYTTDSAPGGPIDRTPIDHTTGLGFGAGLDPLVSQEQNAAAHRVDSGATDARRFSTPVMRPPGETLDVSLYRQPDVNVDSPGYTELQRRAQPAVSPDARRGLRQTRFFHRHFGFNSEYFANDHRPRVVTNAFTAPNVPAPPQGATATTPYASQAPVRVVRSIVPQLRRAPRPWDEAATTSGPDTMTEPPLQGWGL